MGDNLGTESLIFKERPRFTGQANIIRSHSMCVTLCGHCVQKAARKNWDLVILFVRIRRARFFNMFRQINGFRALIPFEPEACASSWKPRQDGLHTMQEL